MAKKNDNYVDLKTQPIPEGQHLLEVDDLKMYFHTEDGVVHAVDGETLALVGESGSGKSVTAMTIMGLISMPPGKIEGGSVTYRGHDLLSMSEEEMQHVRGNDIAMIFQDPMTSLNPVYTVGNQIMEMLQEHEDIGKGEAKRRAIEMLRMVGIPSPEKRIHNYPHEFSGGMRQRAMIAIALACSPKLLIADEPTTALDVTIQAQILNLIKRLNRELDMTTILITHDLGVVAQVCDRVAIMYAGEIVESGTIAEVFDHPHHPYTIGLFGSIPSLDETAEKLKPISGQMPDPTELPEGCAFAPRCPYATGACRTRKPEMTGVGGTQMVRCLAHQGVFESPELMEEVRHGR